MSSGPGPRRRSTLVGALIAAALAGCGEPGLEEQLGPNDLPLTCLADPDESFDARVLIGETAANAARIAANGGCRMRVVLRDGEPVPRGPKERRDIDVAVDDGYVVSVRPFGYEGA